MSPKSHASRVAPSSLAERVARLPAPQPGKVVSIPLELAPYWLKHHHREIAWFDERRVLFHGHRCGPVSEKEETHETDEE